MLDFLLIGAQKAGTTWISEVLREHPQVQLSRNKELHFYNNRRNYSKGQKWYLEQFDRRNSNSITGECTPNYLWVNNGPPDLLVNGSQSYFSNYKNQIWNIPELVKKDFPDLKFIVCLRNPVNRAISSYYHAINKGRIPPFQNITYAGGKQGLVGMGFYYSHLMEWFEYFDRERFLILIYELDVKENKDETLKKIYQHLGVDDCFVPSKFNKNIHQTNTQLYTYFNYFLPGLTKLTFKLFTGLNRITSPVIPILDQDKDFLYDIYHEENIKLERLIDRSLAIWHRE